MKTRQWEVWKSRPPGFQRDHWFVILSPLEVGADDRSLLVNALACFSLRGEPDKLEVRLNGADGFNAPTVCDCGFVYVLEKARLHSSLGTVSWERQQQIKARVREIFRLL